MCASNPDAALLNQEPEYSPTAGANSSPRPPAYRESPLWRKVAAGFMNIDFAWIQAPSGAPACWMFKIGKYSCVPLNSRLEIGSE
jgi:hypothetical protein